MKHSYTTCDICGKILKGNHDESKIKFKMKSYDGIDYSNFDGFEYQRWTKLDICDSCKHKIIRYCVKELNNEG